MLKYGALVDLMEYIMEILFSFFENINFLALWNTFTLLINTKSFRALALA